MLLVASLSLGCIPVRTGGCCDRTGHCNKITKNCDNQPVAVLNAAPPAVAFSSAVVPIPAEEVRSSTPVTVIAQDSPPDLCLLHSLLRI